MGLYRYRCCCGRRHFRSRRRFCGACAMSMTGQIANVLEKCDIQRLVIGLYEPIVFLSGKSDSLSLKFTVSLEDVSNIEEEKRLFVALVLSAIRPGYGLCAILHTPFPKFPLSFFPRHKNHAGKDERIRPLMRKNSTESLKALLALCICTRVKYDTSQNATVIWIYDRSTPTSLMKHRQ